MYQQFNRIFLGTTPAEHRKYITKTLQFLCQKYPKIHIPCVGFFSLAKCAIEAGYKKENIYTSDITTFSNALGYYYSGKPLSDLNLTINDEYYHGLEDETKKLAYLLFLIKLCQIKGRNLFEENYKENILDQKDSILESLEKQLVSLKDLYTGINYDIKDVRDVINATYSDDTLVLINPPVFTKGYSKMFDTAGVIESPVVIEEFNWKKEYNISWEKTKAMNCPVIWFRDSNAEEYKENIIFSNQIKDSKYDFWLITKPEVLEGYDYNGIIHRKKETLIKSWKSAPIWSDEDGINETDSIRFVNVPKEVALYYRDLFAHRLGSTKAERYYLILLNAKVFGAVGFLMGDLFRLKGDYVFENFGFSAPSKKYPNKNRLLMRLITCKEMKELLIRESSQKNRIYSLNRLKTACLTKYRKNKLNNGLLEVISTKKLDNDMYHLIYEAEFRNESFNDQLKYYLQEWQEKYK